MKRIDANGWMRNIGRVNGGQAFIMFALAVLCCSGGASDLHAEGAKPKLRVGIISDMQSRAGKTTNRGQLAMRKAMEHLKELGIDVLIVAGDIANDGDKKVFEEYREIVDEVYGKEQPEEFAIMGNHDYWNGKKAAEAQKIFLEGMKLDSIYKHKVVGGYDFIAVSPDNGDCTANAYGKEAADYLRREVAAAVARDPGKPVFVITHQHAKGTVYGSDGWGNAVVSEILGDYENVLLFSGHSHFPLEDERSIDQGRFSAIGTSSLAYCELERGRVNGTVPPYASDCRQYLLMEVYEDRLLVKRFNLEPQGEVKPGARWVLPLPLKKENFVYTAKRAESRKAPAFPSGAKASVSFPEKGPITHFTVTFTAARHDDFVHTYRVAVSRKEKDGSWAEVRGYDFFSDFYRGLKKMANPYAIQMPAEIFESGCTYKLDIRPIESFGKIGDVPVSVEFVMPKK